MTQRVVLAAENFNMTPNFFFRSRRLRSGRSGLGDKNYRLEWTTHLRIV